MNAIEIRNLQCGYQEQAILQNISFVLEERKILALLGPSGCGKTTLLKAIAGLIPIEHGQIYLHDQLVQDGRKGLDPEERGVGFIFQDYALFPHMNVHDNLMFGLRPLRLKKQDAEERIASTLVTVGLAGMEKRYPHELSGGQQQRVAIARSLVCRPKLMLLDEPFSNIDSQLRIPLIREIRELLKSQHITAIFVTHNKEEAFSLADELAVFQQGNIAQQGEASAVYHQPANLYVAEFLGKGNRVPVTRQSDRSVLTPWGVVPVNQVPSHNDLMMFIRPQWLEIVEGGEGRLIEQHFLGTHAHCRIHWQGMELDAWHADSMPISTSSVSLRLRPHQPVIFRREQG